jgi:hypothetical protein
MKRKDRARSPPTTRNIPELGISENKVRLGLPRIIQRKENAPEFDYSSYREGVDAQSRLPYLATYLT